MEETTTQPAIDDSELPEGIAQISAGPEVYGNEEDGDDVADFAGEQTPTRSPATEKKKQKQNHHR